MKHFLYHFKIKALHIECFYAKRLPGLRLICCLSVFQCRTWRGVGSTAGGVLKSRSRARTARCVSVGSATSETSSPQSVGGPSTHAHTALQRREAGACQSCCCCLQPADPNTCWSTSTRTAVNDRPDASTSRKWRRSSPRLASPQTSSVGHHPIPVRPPDFHLCGCASELCRVVSVTEHANHARDHLRTEVELTKFDG